MNAALLLPALSLDTFLVAMAVARTAPPWRIIALLALAEALSPLIGYGVGEVIFLRVAPALAGVLAGILLLGLGILLAREASEDGSQAARTLERAPILGMVAVGLDEFGFGLALAGLRRSPWLALYIVVQAPLAALLGVSLGRRVKPAGWLRYLPAAVLLLLGLGQVLAAMGTLRGILFIR